MTAITVYYMRTIVDNKKKCDNSGLNAMAMREARRIQRS
jgi:hypothetical protein